MLCDLGEIHSIIASLFMIPKIKICCISSVEEAKAAIQAGAAALGLVSKMPSGPGVIPDEKIREIAASVPPPTATFLLTCKQEADSIIEQHRLCNTTTLQLVDHVNYHQLEKLRSNLPGIKLVQVIHVTDKSSVETACKVAPYVDALLLDSGKQSSDVKELGGTGRVHDWNLSKEIRENCDKPIFLAGGLNSGNVVAAIKAVAPYGVDLCSGVRTSGKLDLAKLKDFVDAVSNSK